MSAASSSSILKSPPRLTMIHSLPPSPSGQNSSTQSGSNGSAGLGTPTTPSPRFLNVYRTAIEDQLIHCAKIEVANFVSFHAGTSLSLSEETSFGQFKLSIVWHDRGTDGHVELVREDDGLVSIWLDIEMDIAKHNVIKRAECFEAGTSLKVGVAAEVFKDIIDEIRKASKSDAVITLAFKKQVCGAMKRKRSSLIIANNVFAQINGSSQSDPRLTKEQACAKRRASNVIVPF